MKEIRNINIRNKKASYEYFLLEEIMAGIQLVGTEIKSIRKGNVSIVESFCSFVGNELFLINSYIKEYEFGNQFNHEPRRQRKLLLTKKELKRIRKKTTEKGLTIVPVNMFINKHGFCKVTISIAKGKKLYDKRNSIKDRDMKRDLERNL